MAKADCYRRCRLNHQQQVSKLRRWLLPKCSNNKCPWKICAAVSSAIPIILHGSTAARRGENHIAKTSAIFSVQSQLAANTALTCCVCPAAGSKRRLRKRNPRNQVAEQPPDKRGNPVASRNWLENRLHPHCPIHIRTVANKVCVSFPHSQVLIL